MSLLKAENIVFGYNKQIILNNISLSLNPGEIYCLMGPNGCGKSTLLDCILGVNKIQSGNIILHNKNLNTYNATELAQQMAYVPQIHEKTFPFTVKQVVLMGRTAYTGLFAGPDQEAEDLTYKALETVGIAHLAERPYTQISGGEMQLVMLARALTQDPSIIVLDEPTAHLDFHNELLFLQTIIKLLEKQKTAILMATHSPNQPFYFANQKAKTKVLALYNGQAFCKGTPDEVLTEENIATIFQVSAKKLNFADQKWGNIKQIVPLKTINKQ